MSSEVLREAQIDPSIHYDVLHVNGATNLDCKENATVTVQKHHLVTMASRIFSVQGTGRRHARERPR